MVGEVRCLVWTTQERAHSVQIVSEGNQGCCGRSSEMESATHLGYDAAHKARISVRALESADTMLIERFLVSRSGWYRTGCVWLGVRITLSAN